MKATLFQKPLEFSLQIQGEAWCQGETLEGELIVKDHSGRAFDEALLSGIQIAVVYGQLKKVRQKAADAFDRVAGLTIQAGGEFLETGGFKAGPTRFSITPIRIPWSYSLGANAPISDPGGSLFVLYGKKDAPGQLQLVVNPEPMIQEVLKVLEVQYRFIRKTQKANQGAVETKWAPPSAKGFALVDQLILLTRYEGDTLILNYEFQVKSLSAAGPSVEAKKEKRKFEQRLSPARLKTASGRFNFEAVEAALGEILSKVENKITF